MRIFMPNMPYASNKAFSAFASERERQLHDLKYDAKRDDGYIDQQLALAAAWFAVPEHVTGHGNLWPRDWALPSPTFDDGNIPRRKRQLEKAAALLAAEWERLERIEFREATKDAAKAGYP